jgi:hypothetical protein
VAEGSKIIITDADELMSPTVSQEIPTTIETQAESRKSKIVQGVFKKEYESGKKSYAKIIKHSFIFLLVIALVHWKLSF